MPNSSHSLLNYLRVIVGAWREDARTDAELLARFAEARDETAFTTLVWRHGALVWGTCRRILGDTPDAEDAFQAAFLSLARTAGHCAVESLPSWLHQVARRAALDVQSGAQRRRGLEQRLRTVTRPGVQEDTDRAELYAALDEELAGLPEKLRVPLVLRYLDGKTQNEVASILGCSRSVALKRLAKGEALLRERLERRGLGVGIGSMAALLGGASAGSAVPAPLAHSTVKAALRLPAAPVADGFLSTWAAGWAKGILRTLGTGKTLPLVLGTAAFSALLAGAGVWAYQHKQADTSPTAALSATNPLPLAAPREKPKRPNPPSVSSPANEAPALRDAAPVVRKKAAEPEAPAQIDGPTALVRGKVLDAAEHAVPFAAVTALVRRPFRPGEQALRDEVVSQGKADEQGNYRLRVPANFPTWFPERQVVLVAKAPGHAPLTTIVRLTKREATEVDLRLTAKERIIRGRLLAPDGTAAPGVRLRVIRLGDVSRETVQGIAENNGRELGWPAPVVSDAEGRFALKGIDPEQGVWLQVEDDRYAPDAFGLRGMDKAAEIRLKQAQEIEGRIVAADTGKAIAGVKLTARLPGPAFNPGRFTVSDYLSMSARILPPGSIDSVTRADGRFRLRPPVGPKTIVEVHPPADSPYLAVGKEVDWSEGLVRQTLALALPRGVVVRGRVVDQDGAPVAGASVQFCSPPKGNPAFRPEVLQIRYRIVLAGKDGRFSLTVPAGPILLMAQGPTHEYREQTLRLWSVVDEGKAPERWSWREPLPGERRFYTHAQEALQLTLTENPAEVRLQLVRGETVAGRMVGPDGAPIKAAVLLCGEKVSPLRQGAVLPLPVHEGRYELPGCVAGRAYPVLFLDAVNGWGAAVDLMASRGVGPEVKLARCGSARVRLVDAKGWPLAGRGPRLGVLTERSFAADKPPLERAADGHYSECYDARHYCTDPVSDGDGWLTLPALIPGARYALEYADVEGVLRHTPEFRVEPGEQLQLPELAIRDRQ